MDDQNILRKKKLLAQKEALLEAIGQEIFEQGDLPGNFRLLRQEFTGMDTLVVQLRDRYRALKEEYDRVHSEELVLVNRLAKLENSYEKKLGPPRRGLNALNLKKQHAEDQAERVDPD